MADWLTDQMERVDPVEPVGSTSHPGGLVAGVRTFLIADVRGYSTYTYERGDEAAARLAHKLALIVRAVVSDHGGDVIELRGDEALAVFESTRSALRASVALQGRFKEETAVDPSLPLNVGIGLDAGEAVAIEGGFRGAALNMAARLCSLAAAGEVLASDAVVHLARRIEGLAYRDRGQVELKGFAEPVTVLEVVEDVQESVENRGAGAGDAEESAPVQELPIGSFLGSLPSGTLAARDREFGRICEAVDAVAQGQSRLLLLAGEPGVGKTRLAQEATLHLRNRNFLIAAGRCYEPERTVPYYPFLDVLATVFASVPHSMQREAERRWPYLAALLPDQLAFPQVAGGEDEQQRVFRAVTGFLETVATTRPLGLLLDDLHWADSGSLRLLLHLTRHAANKPIFILGTYRDTEVGRQHPLEAALRDLYREGLVERIDVRRLDQDGTARLIAGNLGEDVVSREFAELLHDRTEGNPYFVQQVLRELVKRGDVFCRDGIWDRRSIGEIEVPESIRSVIGQRVSHLDTHSQEVLQEASVFGSSFLFDDLLAMTDHDERVLERAMEEACMAGLVQETGNDAYAFDHALTRQTLYAELPGRRKRRLHLAAAEALERLPERRRAGRAAELAWHFLEGDDPERGVHYCMLAGEEAESVFAHDEAELQYRTAVQLSRDLGDRELQAHAAEKLGNVLAERSLTDQSLEVLEEAVRLYHASGDLQGEARATSGIGSALMHLGHTGEAVARLESMLDALDGDDPTQAVAEVSVQLCAILYGSGQYDACLERVGRSADIARIVGSPRLLASAENYRADVYMQMGRFQDARRVFETVLPAAEASGDLGTLAHTVHDLATTYVFTGPLDLCERSIRRAVDLQKQRESPSMVGFALAVLGIARFYSGNWSQGRASLEEAVERIRNLPPSWHAPFSLALLGMLETAEGRWDAARELLQQAIAHAEASRVLLPFIHGQLAEYEIWDGRPSEARTRLEPFTADHSIYVTMMLPTLALAQIESEDVPAADATTVLAVQRASQVPLVLTEALCIQGVVRCRQSKWNEALACFNESLSIARRLPYPHAEARTLYALGHLYVEQGDRERALRLLTEATVIFQRLGAQPYIERTNQARASLA